MDSDLKFKVFRRGDDRRAFRLEHIFWELLEQAAKSNGKNLRDFVFAITDSSPQSRNLSSELRSVAAGWAAKKLEHAAAGTNTDAAMKLFHASPAPGIIIAENRRIVAYNKAMLAYLQRRRAGFKTREMASVRFSFELPIAQIMGFLVDAPGKFFECRFRIMLGEENVSGRARIWLSWDADKQERHLGAFILGEDQ